MNKKVISLVVSAVLLFGCSSGSSQYSNSNPPPLKSSATSTQSTTTSALSSNIQNAVINNLTANIATSASDFSQATNFANNTVVGAVVAGSYSSNVNAANSGTAANNYMYTWTRDTALTMNEIEYLFNLAVKNGDQTGINKYGQYMLGYVNWLNTIDANSNFSPAIAKCYVNGTPDTNWMWPQTDGPALVSIALINFANTLLDNNVTINGTTYAKSYVLSNLYDPTMNQDQWGIIKYNLQYVASNLTTSGYDIWESVQGIFLFNQLVQNKALVMGAALADKMNDSGAGNYYLQTAYNTFANSYFDNNYYKQYSYNGNVEGSAYMAGLSMPTNVDPTSPNINSSNFNNYRGMGLDIASLLGILYARFTPDENSQLTTYIPESSQVSYLQPLLSSIPNVNSQQTANTVQLLVNAFASNGMNPYAINSGLPAGVAALGRYPGDLYSGATWNDPSNPANAWFISTLALAQYYYLTNQTTLGNEVMNVVSSHWDSTAYTMNEQFDANTGVMTSFQNLSWSYAMYLMTYRVYNEVNGQ